MIDDITFWINLGVSKQHLDKPVIQVSPNPGIDVLNIICDNFKNYKLSTLSGNTLLKGIE